MAYTPLDIKPGVQYHPTPLKLGQAGWHFSNLVRWKNGQVQKLGGSTRMPGSDFIGTARGVYPHVDLLSVNYMAIGTNQRLQLYTQTDQVFDITPIRTSTNNAINFDCIIGSNIVTVHDTPVVAPGDWVYIVNSITLQGMLIQGFYQVVSIQSGGYQIAIQGQTAGNTQTGGGIAVTYTTNTGSHEVALSAPGYTFVDNSIFHVGITTNVAGLSVPAGDYTILDDFGPYIQSIAAGVANGSATENGNNVKINYLLQTALEGFYSTGYGFGPYGYGPYGMSNDQGDAALRVWSLASWGQDLLASPAGGAIYYWQPPIADQNTAALLAGAPIFNAGIFVATTQQIVISYGAQDAFTGNLDPMLVRWSDVSDFNDWTPTVTNQAGSFRLPVGNRIVAGLTAPQQGLLWTDQDLWAMSYIGYPYVFGFNRVGWACGAVSQRSIAKSGANIMWMSQQGFFSFDGTSVSPVQCPVWDYIYQQIDNDYPDAIFSAVNTYFNELWWFFPTEGSIGVATDYVKYNLLEQTWDFGEMQRSAWTDQSAFGPPIAADYNSRLQQHETSPDLDGQPMLSHIDSGLMGLSEGENFVFLERCLPDIQVTANSTVYIAFRFYEYEGDENPTVKGPFQIGGNQDYIIVRGRGRYVSVTVGSSFLGAVWRLGKIENLIQASGRRR